jgi:hypothetical protein
MFLSLKFDHFHVKMLNSAYADAIELGKERARSSTGKERARSSTVQEWAQSNRLQHFQLFCFELSLGISYFFVS